MRAEKPPARTHNVLAIIDGLRFNYASGMLKKIQNAVTAFFLLFQLRGALCISATAIRSEPQGAQIEAKDLNCVLG